MVSDVLSAECASQCMLLLQATRDGSLAFLVRKARTQPQIYTAYLSTAPMRSKEQTAEFEATVAVLQVGGPASSSNDSCNATFPPCELAVLGLLLIYAGLSQLCRVGGSQDGNQAC